MAYVYHLIIYLEIYIIVALSLNIVVGYCGLLTLAQASYFAVGGYSYALLTIVAGWGVGGALLGGVLISSTLSVALSLSAWRLKGDFFFLASLSVQTLLYSVLSNWSDSDAPVGSWRNLTNGSFGISAIPRPMVFGVLLNAQAQFACFAGFITILCALIVWRVTTSPWGRAIVSMRDDELAARSLGKNTRLLKVEAMALSTGLVAVAGALYAAYVGYLDPSSGSIDESILMLSMVLVGGVGNFRGPIVGAGLLVILPELLRFLNLPETQAANIRLAIYGALLVALARLRPEGAWGRYRPN